MKKLATRMGTGLLVLSLLGSAFAAPKNTGGNKMSSPKMGMSKSRGPAKAARETQVTGTVTAASATSLTITPVMKKNGASQTFMVPASAKIMWGKRTISMNTVKPGQRVTVTNRGGAVTRVLVQTAGGDSGGKSKGSNKMSGGKMSAGKMSGKKK
ncbi:MAG: hypothetical protein JO316_12665 [Abitibacteriaceae bacterium]|nr:hypothetical protein [Abditibacteriaceae bacterium]MBV9866198.1 hypothetical protein [Abditibacteriaceae bacterium]